MALFLDLDESAGIKGRDAEMIKKTLLDEMELDQGLQKPTLQQRLASGAAKASGGDAAAARGGGASSSIGAPSSAAAAGEAWASSTSIAVL